MIKIQMRKSSTSIEARRERKERMRKEEEEKLLSSSRKKKKEDEADITPDVSTAIRNLYLDNKRLLDSIGDIEKQEHDLIVKKRECILALAENFEKLHELGDYKEPISAICSSIVGLARERGFFATESWIRDSLPLQYKKPMMFHIPEPLPSDCYFSSQFDSVVKDRRRRF